MQTMVGVWLGTDLEKNEAELANAMAAVPQQQAVVRSAEIDLERMRRVRRSIPVAEHRRLG